MDFMKSSTTKLLAYSGPVIILTLVCLSTRIVPTRHADRANWTTIAERLLAGDRLYADVFNTKDPMFLYMVAMQRLGGAVFEYLFELMFLLIAGAAVFHILRHYKIDFIKALFVSAVVIPLILTGEYYIPGDTHLPGVTLSLLACLAIVKSRVFAAGFAIGFLFFTKLIMDPFPIVFYIP